MKIVAFVGMPASGKGEASKVASSLGMPVVNMGDVIREEVVRSGGDMSDTNTGTIAMKLRNRNGADVVAVRCTPKILSFDASVVVVDGVRSVDEVEYFKGKFGDDFVLVAVEASAEQRLERIQRRKRADRIIDREGFLSREARELGWGIKAAIERADMVVENNGSITEFHKKIKQLLEETL
ncbi:dephospho-CoA kinase [Methanosarcinales archaeon]|nr:MAG: dephospho-CoA kinase [Methanosarcinales archaeon]